MSNKRGKMVRVSPEMNDLLLTEKERRGNKHVTDTSKEIAREFKYYKDRDDVLNEEVDRLKKIASDFRVFKK